MRAWFRCKGGGSRRWISNVSEAHRLVIKRARPLQVTQVNRSRQFKDDLPTNSYLVLHLPLTHVCGQKPTPIKVQSDDLPGERHRYRLAHEDLILLTGRSHTTLRYLISPISSPLPEISLLRFKILFLLIFLPHRDSTKCL